MPDITTNRCEFKQNEHGWWVCVRCEYVYKRACLRAPNRRCGRQSGQPPEKASEEECGGCGGTHTPVKVSRDTARPVGKVKRPIDSKLNDRLRRALTIMEIDLERVEKWVGHLYSCSEQSARLNRINAWATRVVGGDLNRAEEYLEEILSE